MISKEQFRAQALKITGRADDNDLQEDWDLGAQRKQMAADG